MYHVVDVSYNGRKQFLIGGKEDSAKAGRSGGTQRLRQLRLINASSRWHSAALVNPHQAQEAYVSLEIITDRYMACNDESMCSQYSQGIQGLCAGADDAMCMFCN